MPSRLTALLLAAVFAVTARAEGQQLPQPKLLVRDALLFTMARDQRKPFIGYFNESRPEDLYWFTLDGALDHLQHGITAVYSFDYGWASTAKPPPTSPIPSKTCAPVSTPSATSLIIDPTRFGPVADPYASLVFVTSEPDLESVYVGGMLRVDHGHLIDQNISKVNTEVKKRVARIRAKQ